MPLGWERINAKKSSPNENIVFIKPRSGPDESIAKDFLECIAAQCFPVMKKHKLAIVSLEEYEPNLEFWGRNFNSGEVIQLVLKSPSTSRWLPFKFVQMVMMHELAHCKQMNHSKAFWTLRNEYANEMKALWEKDYTGEGLWGRGFLLKNGLFSHENLEEGEILPENMCGGTFRSRISKKRKAKTKLTYKERQERKVKKKFGTNGIELGADDGIKLQLEKKTRQTSKPRVAGSLRGRELRAAAALARIETKAEQSPTTQKDNSSSSSDSGSDSENEIFIISDGDDARDINGKKLLDIKGQAMINVCTGGDKEDPDTKSEMLDLLQMSGTQPPVASTLNPSTQPSRRKQDQKSPTVQGIRDITIYEEKPTLTCFSTSDLEDRKAQTRTITKNSLIHNSCTACTFVNGEASLTCMVCSNVLKPELISDSWKCTSPSCKDDYYINAGDVVFCGICAARRETDFKNK